MENQNYPPSKHALSYGIYTSVVLIILSLIYYVLDIYMERWPAFISYAALLGGVVLSSLHYRTKRMGGFITYGQSFSAGFFAGLYAAIIVGIFSYIFIYFMGEDYMDVLIQKAEESALEKNPNMSDDEYDMTMKFTRWLMQPWVMAILGMLSFAFYSLVFSLIASIFIKRPNPDAAGA
jgi:hypothetical protein